MSILDDFISTFKRINENENASFYRTLDVALAKTRRHTQSEAGTIFMLEKQEADASEEGEKPPLCLKAICLQNDRIAIEEKSFTIPLNGDTVASYVAREGEGVEVEDLYRLPVHLPYKFNKHYDDQIGYRSQSMIAFPLKNLQGEVIGVIQLLNHVKKLDEEGIPVYGSYPARYVEDMKHLLIMIGIMIERASLLMRLNLIQESDKAPKDTF